jgi:hypothetical protein
MSVLLFFILSSVFICLDTISIILLFDARKKVKKAKKAKIQNVGKHFDKLLEKEAFYLGSTIICSSLTLFFIIFDIFIK